MADRLTNWLKGQFSLDTPEQDFLSPETGGDFIAGMTPGVGTAMSVRDIARAVKAKDPVAGGLAALGLLPFGRLGTVLKNKLIKDAFHATPRDIPIGELKPGMPKPDPGHHLGEHDKGLWFSTDPEIGHEYMREGGPYSGQPYTKDAHVHVVDLAWPDAAREAKDPLGLHHFTPVDIDNGPIYRSGLPPLPEGSQTGHHPGYDQFSIMDPKLIRNERKMKPDEFARKYIDPIYAEDDWDRIPGFKTPSGPRND